jgi:hypothetical protein
MKKILFLFLVFVSCLAHAEPAKRLSYQTWFVPLGEPCDTYYSLNIEGRVCIKNQLHYRIYEIVYVVRGEKKVARLTYIPERTFEVDGDQVRERNHTVRPDQSF